MTAGGKDKGVFAGRDRTKKAGGGRRGRGRKKKAPRPARPLAELKEREKKRAQAASARPVSLRERVAGVLPLFGVINVRELGLIAAIAGGTMAMWPHLRPWGFLLAAAGFVVMRYGENWLAGGRND
ncbi:MAG TPA: hypothetical protein DHW14_00230 [Clostridiales bacterium]|nr:hypothetical protein [Clostridiales bacterium]